MSTLKKIFAPLLDLFGSPKKGTVSRLPVLPTSVNSNSNGSLPTGARKTSLGNKSIASPIEKMEKLTITKKEFFPSLEDILTVPGGEISLSNGLDADYIVILTNLKSKSVIIVCSVESNKSGLSDNTYLTLKQRCVDKGYSVRRMYAPRQIIRIVYDDFQAKKNTSTLDKDQSEGFTSDYDDLLEEGVNRSVSDIHIEVRKSYAHVKFRIHGELSIVKEWTTKYGRDMCVVIYQVLAAEKDVTFIESVQQSARIERLINGDVVSVRLNTIPVSGGFDMVMRILRSDVEDTKNITIDSLGYNLVQQKKILRGLDKPVGMLCIAGTTGSGKSTSLSTMLNGKIREKWGVDGPSIKVITVEDPTEYLIQGASQQGVVRRKGLKDKDENPFADAIRAAMRCDPDILMIGEVRDDHSAELLMHAVQTGHTALTTVHTSSGINIVSRLRGLGIPDDVLGNNDFVSLLMYQTLVQVTCRHCGYSFDQFSEKANNDLDEKSIELIGRLMSVSNGRSLDNVFFRNRSGCKHCINGVSGRTVVAEVIEPNARIRSAIENRRDNLALYYHLKAGGERIIDHALEKVFAGIIDPFTTEDAVGYLDGGVNFIDLAESLGMSTLKDVEEPGIIKPEGLVNLENKEIVSIENIKVSSKIFVDTKDVATYPSDDSGVVVQFRNPEVENENNNEE